MSKCPKCGFSTDMHFSFCPKCGTKIDSNDTNDQQAQQNAAAQNSQYQQFGYTQNIQPQQYPPAQNSQYQQYGYTQNIQPQQYPPAQNSQYQQFGYTQNIQPQQYPAAQNSQYQQYGNAQNSEVQQNTQYPMNGAGADNNTPVSTAVQNVSPEMQNQTSYPIPPVQPYPVNVSKPPKQPKQPKNKVKSGSADKGGGRKKSKIIIITIIIVAVLALVGLGTWMIISLTKPNTEEQFKQYIQQGDKAAAEIQAQQAIEAYTKAKELDPKNITSYLKLADIYMSNNALSNAISILDEGLKNTDNDPHIKEKKDTYQKIVSYNENMKKGDQAKKSSDYNTALSCYLEASRVKEDEPDAYINAADCCVALSDYDQALSILQNGKSKTASAKIDNKTNEVKAKIEEEKQRQEEEERQRREEEERKRQEEEKQQKLLTGNILEDQETVEFIKEQIKKEANGSKIAISLWTSADDMAFEKELLEEFKQLFGSDGVEFNIKVVANGPDSAASRALDNPKRAGDLFVVPDDMLPYLNMGGVIAKVADYYKDNVCNANTSDSISVSSIGENLYAYPRSCDNGYYLYYDKRVFTEDDVKSFDKIIEVAKKAGKKVFFPMTNSWYTTGFFLTAGCTIKYENGKQITEFDTPQGMSAVKAMAHICENDGNGFVGSPGQLVNEYFVKQGFEDGDLCAAVTGSWMGPDIKSAIGEENVGCAKLPTVLMDGEQKQLQSFGGYKLLAVNVFSEYPFTAQTLAYFLTNEASQYRRFQVRGALPTNTETQSMQGVKNDPAFRAVEEQLPYSVSQNNTVGSVYWGSGVANIGSNLLSNPRQFDESKYKQMLKDNDEYFKNN